MHVCATLVSSGGRLRKHIQKIIRRKKSQSRYISRMRGGALIQPIAIEVCISVLGHQCSQSAIFGGCTLRGLVSAKGQI
jgi:hypothetical protein